MALAVTGLDMPGSGRREAYRCGLLRLRLLPPQQLLLLVQAEGAPRRHRAPRAHHGHHCTHAPARQSPNCCAFDGLTTLPHPAADRSAQGMCCSSTLWLPGVTSATQPCGHGRVF